MKSILLLLLLTFSVHTFGQKQELDSEIVSLFKDIASSCDFIETMNYYLSVEFVEDVDKKSVSEFLSLCRCINKKDIPIYEIRTNKKTMDFYFKKGSLVYSFTLEKKDNLYYSVAKCYTFKNRRIKKQGSMAFKV